MTHARLNPAISVVRTAPSASWRGAWSVVGQPVLRQWWFPASLRPAVLRAFGAEVDDRVVILQGVRVSRPWRLRIDGPAWIGHGVVIDHDGDVTVERDVSLGRGVVVASVGRGTAPVVLRRGAWVAAEARLGAGCEVGEYAVIGAGAEIEGVVEPGSIVGPTNSASIEDAVVTP